MPPTDLPAADLNHRCGGAHCIEKMQPRAKQEQQRTAKTPDPPSHHSHAAGQRRPDAAPQHRMFTELGAPWRARDETAVPA